MGYREADIVAFEEAHIVHASTLEFDDDAEPTLPPSKRARAGRTR